MTVATVMLIEIGRIVAIISGLAIEAVVNNTNNRKNKGNNKKIANFSAGRFSYIPIDSIRSKFILD